jgi:hypothetical protein
MAKWDGAARRGLASNVRRTTKRIVVGGSLAQKPGYGGHSWVFLQYLLGFRRLGWDVLFVDRLQPGMCHDRAGSPCSLSESVNLPYFSTVMEGFGLRDACALLDDEGRSIVGLPRDEVLERMRTSVLLLNVMGYITDEELLSSAPRRVFLDIDPGFGQMWREQGLHNAFEGYDDLVTIAENIGEPSCRIPTCGLDWITTRQPVVLSQWPASRVAGSCFTTIASWRGMYSPLVQDGRRYGLRVHEFRRFFELPRLSRQRFELALAIGAEERDDLRLLDANGWRLADPAAVAGDPWDYRRYIEGSLAEFTVAKGMYVHAKSGWFSDRSICYLASGKPVVAQDTGLEALYPTAEGLVTFEDPGDARAAVEEVGGNYARHARAARDLAEGWFDSDKVLGRLLAKLGVE